VLIDEEEGAVFAEAQSRNTLQNTKHAYHGKYLDGLLARERVLFSIKRRVATRCNKLTRNMHTTAGTWGAYRQGRGGYLRRGVQLQHTATHSHGTFIPQQVLCGLLGKGEDAIFDEAQNVAMFGRGAE